MRRRVITTAGALLACALCNGCVFDDIHEEMQATHGTLRQTETVMSDSSASLDRLEGQLASMLEQNAALLRQLESQQQVLVSIDHSLARLDEHLASLRGTIDAIDSRIPFISFGSDKDGDAEESEEALPLDSDGLPTVRVAPPDAPTGDSAPQPEPEPEPASAKEPG